MIAFTSESANLASAFLFSVRAVVAKCAQDSGLIELEELGEFAERLPMFEIVCYVNRASECFVNQKPKNPDKDKEGSGVF